MDKEKNCFKTSETASVGECEYVTVDPITVPAGETIIRVPVTLAELTIRTNLSATIHFPEPVLEIKDIKKRVKIVQCKLLIPSTFAFETGLSLFIKGFVRKNIQYATPCPKSSECGVLSEMRSFTTDIPFECVSRIADTDFLTLPQRPQFNSRAEFDFFREQELGKGYPEKDHLLSSDLSQFHQVSTQHYNQMPYCELLRSDIVEWDEAIDRRPLSGNAPFEEGTFQNAVEKMFLQFTVKILQNRQVAITAITPTPGVANNNNNNG
ncbi:CsxC family protein [Cytobacillus sp. FSL H8-0458]|uniref:CsxC family protein n=1 Tax=Cytobacillus sp. FSL H8-0458 TaxID=2975346 RepID=UPI0030FC3493